MSEQLNGNGVGHLDASIEKQKEAEAGRYVPVNDLNQFVQFINHWHRNQLKQLNHLMAVPEGTIVTMPSAEGEVGIPDIPLTGDARKAFIIGLFTAKSLFGTLPFVAEMTPADEEQPTQPEANG